MSRGEGRPYGSIPLGWKHFGNMETSTAVVHDQSATRGFFTSERQRNQVSATVDRWRASLLARKSKCSGSLVLKQDSQTKTKNSTRLLATKPVTDKRVAIMSYALKLYIYLFVWFTAATVVADQ